MKRIFLVSAVLIAVVSFFGCSGGKKGTVLVTVGGEKITEGDLAMLPAVNPRLKDELATEFGRKKLLDNLVEQELLYQASLSEGLDKNTDLKNRLDILKKIIISQAYLDKALKERARKVYEGNKAEFEKIKLSHIYIPFKTDDADKSVKRDEKQALDLANKAKARIEGGEKFEDVAIQVSEDTMTSKRGGDLGFASRNEPRLVRRGFGSLLEKAFAMKVGEISGPMKTEKGYHIIILTQGAEVQPFEAAEQVILTKIRASARNEILNELKEKYKVSYLTAKAEAKAEAKTETKAGTPATAGTDVKAVVKPEGQTKPEIPALKEKPEEKSGGAK